MKSLQDIIGPQLSHVTHILFFHVVEPDSDSVVMDEEIDPDYVPGEEEVVEYAQWLGMDLVKDKDLFWIAREGLLVRQCATESANKFCSLYLV